MPHKSLLVFLNGASVVSRENGPVSIPSRNFKKGQNRGHRSHVFSEYGSTSSEHDSFLLGNNYFFPNC